MISFSQQWFSWEREWLALGAKACVRHLKRVSFLFLLRVMNSGSVYMYFKPPPLLCSVFKKYEGHSFTAYWQFLLGEGRRNGPLQADWASPALSCGTLASPHQPQLLPWWLSCAGWSGSEGSQCQTRSPSSVCRWRRGNEKVQEGKGEEKNTCFNGSLIVWISSQYTSKI